MPVAIVPPPPEGQIPAINPQSLQEAAHSNAEIMRERRAESQIQKNQRTKRADTVLGDAVTAAEDAMNSTAHRHLSVEDAADRVVKRMAMIALNGGRAFTPVTLREVTDAATAWSGIAYKEAQRRKLASLPDTDESEDPVKRAQAAMKQLAKRAKEQSQAS